MKAKSAILSAIIAVATGLLSWFIKNQYTAILEGSDLIAIAVYTGVFFALAIIVASIDILLTWIWNRFVRYRIFWHWMWGETFIEGFWVDVGIDTTGNQSRLLNYSGIVIWRKNDSYHVEGESWDFANGNRKGWYSDYCEFKGKKLSFWYTGDRPGSENDKAEYVFAGGGRFRPTEFDGTYGDENFKTKGRLHSIAAPDDRKSTAEGYMREIKGKEQYDDNGMQILLPYGVGRPPPDRFRVFARRSDKQQQEMSLLQNATTHVRDRQIQSILDVGPAEGQITVSFIKSLQFLGVVRAISSYVGVDPCGAYLDILESHLASILLAGTISLIKGRVEGAFPAIDQKEFDLIMLLNVLYYQNDVKPILERLAKRVVSGGYMLSLHTDIQHDKFIHEMTAEANPLINQRIVESVSAAAAGGEMILIAREEGRVTIDFPEVSDAQWDAIERGTNIHNHVSTSETVDLICFMADKSMDELQVERKWERTAARFRKQLRRTGNKLELPIVLQTLRRK